MSEIDKNQAVIDYLNTCPSIAENPLFFNFANAKDENKQISVKSSDKNKNRQYIDGSVEKQFAFTIYDFKSISYNAIVTIPGFSNENVDELKTIQGIIDWVTEQNEIQNFPNFGDMCIIDSIYTTTENPDLVGVDKTVSPQVAVYAITINVDYLDISKKVWQNN